MSGEHRSKPVSAAKLALAVKRLRSETDGIDLLASEPLAIVGMACKLPRGVDTPEEFWRVLIERRSTIREMPLERWKQNQFLPTNLRLGGYFDDITTFDADFFGIAPLEAESIDPQHRLILETTWGALLDAGIPPESLSGTSAGVFVAVSNSDYARMQLRNVSSTTTCPRMGAAHCMASGRIAFLLNVHGPNTVVDTACSSSLVAAHLASQSLRNRETNLAIVSAASLKTLPDEVIGFARWGMLAKDARCKTFDAEADGFVPGEGSGTIIIKRLSDALADGNRVRAVIRGSATNHDGRTTVMSAPSGLAQQDVMRAALHNAKIMPEDVSFIETQGTGTVLGDPIEVEALRMTYDGNTETLCALGAVKTNIGNLEAASGIAGIIKIVLALENGVIPPNLNYERLNPAIDLERSRFTLPRQMVPWPRGLKPRIAGLSSFGMSGSNAHFLIEEAPLQPSSNTTRPTAPYLLIVSAKSQPSLRESAQLYSTLLRREDSEPWKICASAALHRSHLTHRLAVTGATADELVQRLQFFMDDQPHPAVHHGLCNPSRSSRLAFVFSGLESTWAGMGCSLLERQPAALAALKEVDEFFAPLSNWSLLEMLEADDLDQRLRRTDIAHPLIFGIQVALVAALATRNIVPAAVTGHSVGEITAAYVSGLLTLEDAVRISYHRGRAMQRASADGRTLTIGCSLSEAEALISRHKGLAIVAYNSPRSLVIAGRHEVIEAVQAELAAGDTFHRLVNVDSAFHTNQMDSASVQFAGALGQVSNSPSQIPFISSQTGRAIKPGEATSQYWTTGIRQPVRLQSAIETLIASGFSQFVELGPRPVLTRDIHDCAREKGVEIVTGATMHPTQSADETLGNLTAMLCVNGADIRWPGVFPGRMPISQLPAYPWHRKRYWIDSDSSSTHSSSSSLPAPSHWWLGADVASPFIEGLLFIASSSNWSAQLLSNYRIGNETSAPLGLWLSAASHAASFCQHGQPFRLIEWTLPYPATPLKSTFQIQTHVTHMRVTMAENRNNGWETALVAQITPLAEQASDALRSLDVDRKEKLDTWRSKCFQNQPVESFYSTLEHAGLYYGPDFRVIQELWTGPGIALSRLHMKASLVDESVNHGLHPALLEGALQTVCAALGSSINAPYFPRALSSFDYYASATDLWAFATIVETGELVRRADIVLVDSHGNTCASIDGLELHPQALTADVSMSASISFREDLRQLSSETDRHRHLTEHIMNCVRLAMGQEASWRVAEDLPLHEVGLDSLMGITLRNILRVSLGVELRSTFTFDHPTVASITQYFETMLWIADDPANQHTSDFTRDEIRL